MTKTDDQLKVVWSQTEVQLLSIEREKGLFRNRFWIDLIDLSSYINTSMTHLMQTSAAEILKDDVRSKNSNFSVCVCVCLFNGHKLMSWPSNKPGRQYIETSLLSSYYHNPFAFCVYACEVLYLFYLFIMSYLRI